MRLAAHTYSFRELPLPAALDELAAAGFRAVELWIGHASEGARAVSRAFADRDLELVAISAGGFYGAPAAAAPAFELAAALDVGTVVACLDPQVADEVAIGVPAGMRLCVENHWDQPLALPTDVAEVVFRHDSLAACLDTGHALLAGVPPERFARYLGGRLGHVHLKEGRRLRRVERLLGRRLRRRLLARPAPVFPGSGVLDVVILRAMLSHVGFDGVVTVEHEGADARAAVAALGSHWAAAAAT